MRKEQNFKWQELTLGVCYYPEQWPERFWRDDLRRMKEYGIFTIRIAEFAWSKVEPREGEFTYVFFDSFLDLAEEEGMKVIFGTPTATPPAWLTEKYPEVLNCRKDGVKFRHGMRRHYNYNSKVYRELSARIVEKIAEHYAKRPCIVGWQIDNEINCEVDEFYSDSDTLRFRDFLKEKYGTLDVLNEAWGTVFWNQTYTEWDEIFVPRVTAQNSANPHLMLDYIRFISDSAVSFCRMQSEILNKYKKPGDFITTNGMFEKLDNHRMMDECLDVYTYDSYPNFAYGLGTDPEYSDDLNDRKWSRNLMEVRSICPHFGIMEQQSGADIIGPAPKPGQMMLWAMQSIAHGADYISFFRWRTATMGSEIWWHGILEYDNRNNRKLKEIGKIRERMGAIAEAAGSDYKAAFALIKDYDNKWDACLDARHGHLADKSEKEIFIASQITHTPMDVVYLLDTTEVEELLKYPVLFYPHPMILAGKKVGILEKYVEDGGILIIGAHAGQKDETGKCVMNPMPGLLSVLTKTIVEDFTLIGPADGVVEMDMGGRKVETGIFNDIIATENEDVKILAEYSSNYYAGFPALIETKAGKGKVMHFGGTFTRENTKVFLEYTGIIHPYEGIIQVPERCEVALREKNGKQYYFVLNYDWHPQKICLKKEAIDMDNKMKVFGNIVLNPYETKVFLVLQ